MKINEQTITRRRVPLLTVAMLLYLHGFGGALLAALILETMAVIYSYGMQIEITFNKRR